MTTGYSVGELKVLDEVAREIRHNGRCALSLRQLGERAGVGRSTTQTAIRKARHAGDLVVKHRPLQGETNLIFAPAEGHAPICPPEKCPKRGH